MMSRQHVYVGMHIQGGEQFRPELSPANAGQVIACIEIIEGLRIQAGDADVFDRLAFLCQEAALSIRQARAEQEQAVEDARRELAEGAEARS